MDYRFRIGGALVASLIINLALLASTPRLLGGGAAIARVQPVERAVRLNLSPPPEPEGESPEQVPRLIDPGAEAEGPAAETDLISSQASQAQDNSDSEGDPARPAVDEVDDFEEMPTAPSASPTPSSASQPADAVDQAEPAEETAAEQAPPVDESETEPEPAPVTAQPNPIPPQPDPVPPAEGGTQIAAAPSPATPAQPATPPRPELTPEPRSETPEAPAEPQPEPVPERFNVAAATPPAPRMPVQELKTSRGREEGGATNSGFTSFEANRHELGEYMLHVRGLVEREWRAALRLRYTGVSRTDAVIECSIRPDGTLEYARVVDAGVSLTYAVLCRQAIEQAAPFGPFPFDVPEIYRKDNLEITWRFSYL